MSDSVVEIKLTQGPKLALVDNFMENYQKIQIQNQGQDYPIQFHGVKKSATEIGDEKLVENATTKILPPISKNSEIKIKVDDLVCAIPWVKRIYCINLESCSERKKQMKYQFKKHNLNGVFFNAIHPRHREFKKRYTQPRWVDQSFDTPRCFCVKPCDHRVRRLRKTEVAIALSHYFIYDKIVKKKHHWNLVCEDDLIFNENFAEIVNMVIPKSIFSQHKPTIIFCGGAKDNYQLKIKNPSKFTYRIMPNGCYSNYCYFINYEAARILRKNFFPIKRPEDSHKRYWIGRKEITAYKFRPVIVGELSSGTNFESVFNRYSLFRAPPRAANIEAEYQPKHLQKKEEEIKQQRKKRIITYSKKRTTVVIKH